jgi:hypothetical protein
MRRFAQIEKIEKRLINDSIDSQNRSIIVSFLVGNRFIVEPFCPAHEETSQTSEHNPKPSVSPWLCSPAGIQVMLCNPLSLSGMALT